MAKEATELGLLLSIGMSLGCGLSSRCQEATITRTIGKAREAAQGL